MDDQELAAIRAARLQQLRQNASSAQASPAPQLPVEGLTPAGAGAGGDPDADAKRAAEEQMRRDLLATVLDSKARERRELFPRLPFISVSNLLTIGNCD